MGTDNLHHKRKVRTARDQKRKNAKRASYDRVLIVCEGEKTEPNYFDELVKHYTLKSANVQVDRSKGSSPKSVLKRAEELANKADGEGNSYDRVYCVFDKDTHTTYKEAVRDIQTKKKLKSFHACVSVPCFEYWILLHFEFKTSPYHAAGKASIADQVIKDLKKHIPNYEKGDKGWFVTLLSRLEAGMNNAERALNAAERNDTDNPTTCVHELVEYLRNLKKEK